MENCNSALAFAAVGIGGCTCNLGRESITSFARHERYCVSRSWVSTPFSSNIYNNIGNIFLDRDDYEKAEFYYKKSLEMNSQIGDAVGIGLCKQNLGSLAINRNNLDAGEKLLMESKEILEEQDSEHLHGTLKGLEMIRELRRI